MIIGNYKESYAADEAIFRTPATRAWMGAAAVAALVFPFLAGGYGDPLLDGASLKEVVPFVVLVLTLMVRPYGLFGTREEERL